MHAVGLHSALAIKRQRKRRDEQKRARERRFSVQSSDSGLTSPGHSTDGLDRRHSRRVRRPHVEGGMDSKVVTSIGMLHIGVVFLVLGIFLIGAGLLPDDITSWRSIGADGWWNELVCTGLFAGGIGIFLIILNRVISKREEDDLNDYVSRQLTRSRSGHRLERDVETGGLTTRHTRRALHVQRCDAERGLENSPEPKSPKSPAVHSGTGQENPASSLEKILEEENSVTEDVRMQGFSAGSLSPVSPCDTKMLLGNGHHHHPMGMSKI